MKRLSCKTANSDARLLPVSGSVETNWKGLSGPCRPRTGCSHCAVEFIDHVRYASSRIATWRGPEPSRACAALSGSYELSRGGIDAVSEDDIEALVWNYDEAPDGSNSTSCGFPKGCSTLGIARRARRLDLDPAGLQQHGRIRAVRLLRMAQAWIRGIKHGHICYLFTLSTLHQIRWPRMVRA
jgi:hypothetical protein